MSSLLGADNALRARRFRRLGWMVGAGLGAAILAGGCPTTSNTNNGNDNNNSFTDSNTAVDTSDNSTFDKATTVKLSSGVSISFTGTVGGTDTVDLYNIGTVTAGDHLVVDVRSTSTDSSGQPALDAVAAIFDFNQDVQAFNDDRDSSSVDPLIDVVIRGPTGNYFLGIAPYPGSGSAGPYKVTITLTHGAVPAPAKQVIFLNWNGGQNVVIRNVGTFNLPPFSGADVGSAFANATQTIKDGVLQKVKQRYAGWNVDFLSSDTSPVPTGAHSTVYFGGNNSKAFAISEQIDTLNADPNDKAIVFSSSFIGAFSTPPTVDQMTTAVADTVAHECGHLLGLVHTRECDDEMNSSCGNDSILVAQAFTDATIDSSVFPVGRQNEPELLNETVGTAP